MSVTEQLSFALRRELDGEVRFDPGSRHLYATDSSHYRQVPIGVVTPRHARDVERAVALCREHEVPITSRGAGTSLAGQAANTAVILDFSRHMDAILALDPVARTARVQPGVVLDDLRAAANAHGLTFGPDPSTHNRCTLGGMIGNNACGVHSVYAGCTVDNVRSLHVLLMDGTRLTAGAVDEDELDRRCAGDDRVAHLYRELRALGREHAALIGERYPEDLPRRVSGFNLPDLLPGRFDLARALVGTEGTCAITLEAEVKLVPWPAARTLVVLGYPDVFAAGDAVPAVLAHDPIGLEGIDEQLSENMRRVGYHDLDLSLLPDGQGWLLVELGGDTKVESDAKGRALMDALAAGDQPPAMKLYDDPAQEAHVWNVRASGLGATSFVPGRADRWTGWEDAAVPPDRVGDYLREFRALLDAHGLDTSLYGHFGDGCIHCRISFDFQTPDGVAAFHRFTSEAADLVVAYGGSLSGEHGDGQARADLLERMYGAEVVDLFRRFKSVFDPTNRLNPGMVVDPHPRTANLRLADYDPWEPPTWFAYPDSGGSFARETLRCVGVGACRRDDGHGTMCPSYMVTHQEEHSTRGRARLLFEMLQPDSDLDGWQDESVAAALDLCLSCKGCKTDCPVDVDMATYKAEFMAHHWDGRRRPLVHHALGRIDRAARLAAKVPGLANLTLSAPLLGAALKRAVGVTTQRPAPRFAAQTFRDWYRRRGSHAPAGAPRVMLFPDTFVDHLEPGVGKASVTVLEAAGYEVLLPPKVCCGRPLYDFGMLELAREYLHELVDALRDHVTAGGLVVGMEPSCIAVFRDELGNLLPDDEDATRLAGATMTLAEFLVNQTDWTPPQVTRSAMVHKHCHQDADIGFDAEAALYDRMGLDWSFTDAGCCGLAGSFGFEADKFEVSRAAGERKLIPMVRAAAPDTIVMADGFSCRTQIADLQDQRGALHLAEVLALALGGDPAGRGNPMEHAADRATGLTAKKRALTGRDVAVLGAGAALAAGLAGGIRRRRHRARGRGQYTS